MSDSSALPAAPGRGLKSIFIGSKGLRAGWGALLFALVTVLLVVGLNVGLHAVHFHGPKSDPLIIDPISTLFQEGLLAGVVVLATLITAGIERRPLRRLGLSLKGALPRLAQGLVFGFLALSGLIGLLVACHAIVIGPIALHGAQAWRYAWQWGAAFLLVGIAEELMFRGYLQQTLARGLNFRWACAITALLFAAAHGFNPGETPFTLAIGAGFALLLSLSVWRTGTLWWAIGFHAAWDWGQSFVYGVADSGHPSVGALMVSRPAGPAWLSGGATGPEGSVLCIAILLAATGAVLLTLRKPDAALEVRG